MKTKRAFLVEPRRFELSEAEIFPKEDQVLLKIAACGLCNWELNHWSGLLGSCPQSLGHECAGIVIDRGNSVKNISVGDMITTLPDSLTGFSEYITVDEKNCFKLEPHINAKYALGEPLKCIVTVLRGTTPEIGDHGVVLGCGPMGLWCIQALSGNMLSSLIAVDIDENKLNLARKFGATHVINSKVEEPLKQIAEITDGRMADFIIEGTGIPSMLNSAQSFIKKTGRGRLILMSSHESVCREFDFREAISRSIQIIVPHPGYSTDQTEDMKRAVKLINKRTFNVEDVVSHEFMLENVQKAFETLENKPAGYLKGIVIP